MTTFIGLLRGVNVGGNNRVSMADLRKLCEKLGYENPRTYVNSGNVVFEASSTAAKLQTELQGAIPKAMKVEPPLIVRTATQWRDYLAPAFPKALPKVLHLGLSQKKPRPECVTDLQARAAAGEKVALLGDALWVDYGESGIARSKLTPAAIDKAVGSPTTLRNWNTVQELAKMAGLA